MSGLNTSSALLFEALSAETLIRELFDRANIGMSLVDVETRRFLRVNEKLCETVGYSASELTSRTAIDLTHPDDRQIDRETFESFVHGELKRRVIEKRYVRKDGSPVWVRITTTKVQLGTQRCAFGITEDISERRAAQAEVEKGERRKDRFLALLAHELRNPLAAIRNCVELMDAAPQDAVATAKCREVIDRQSRNLARLVDDLLDASRITTGKVTLRKHPVPVSEIVAEALDIAQPAVRALEHDVRTILPQAEIWVIGDKLRLVQALGNVLSNAAKYTPRHGLIQTEVRRDGDDVCISVTDNGPGIAEEELPYVFNLFQRVDAAAPAQGLGIGLTVAKQLIEMHDGQVSVKSGLGVGSTFEIRLAATSAPALESVAPHVEEHAASMADILVVEDNIDAAETLNTLLSIRGHRVRLAADGAGAVRAVNEHAPEIILMDIGLPDTDGRELARRFRTEMQTRNALMIAISGYGEQRDIKESLEAGFDHHLTKPIDYEALERLLCDSPRAPVSRT